MAALADGDDEPVVGAAATLAFTLVVLGLVVAEAARLETRHAIVERHADAQLLEGIVGDLAERPHRVFAALLEARVHEPARQLAVVGHQQQAGGVDVETAHRDPAPRLELG